MVTKEEVEKEFDPMDGLEEAKSAWIKWGKPGDWIRGTVTNLTEGTSSFDGKEERSLNIEFMATGGSFYFFQKINGKVEMDKKPTMLEPGSIWIIGTKKGLMNQARRLSVGQIFGMRFAEEKPNKNPAWNPAKIVKLMLGEMDPNYQGESGADMAAE